MSESAAVAAASAAAAASKRSSQTSTSSHKTKSHVGPWRLGRTLGRGSSGRVRLAKHSVTGQLAAVKIVPKSIVSDGLDSGGLPYGIEREVIIMKLIEHPNVMALYDVWENKGELYLVLEYVEGGELFDYLIKKGKLDEREAVSYFRQIIHGVEYCHKFNICHRDLKPENLLLDKWRNIKIADFGMAALETSEKMLETSCGSPHYASPEIVAGEKYHGAPSDIWSCGIILFALLTGHLPFDDDSIRKLLLKVQAGKFTMPPDLSYEAKDLINRMLQIDPAKRITMNDIVSHPLLQKYPTKRCQRQPHNINPEAVARPVRSRADIDPEILKNLQTLWHGEDKENVIHRLLDPEPNFEKTFYCLLLKYRHDHSKLHNLTASSSNNTKHAHQASTTTISTLNDTNSEKPSPSRSTHVHKSHHSRHSRKQASFSHSRHGSRSSIITASSSHRRNVKFSNSRNKSFSDTGSVRGGHHSKQSSLHGSPQRRHKHDISVITTTEIEAVEPVTISTGTPSVVKSTSPITSQVPESTPEEDLDVHPTPRHAHQDGKSYGELLNARRQVQSLPPYRSTVSRTKVAIEEESKRNSADFAFLCEQAFNSQASINTPARSRIVSDPVKQHRHTYSAQSKRVVSEYTPKAAYEVYGTTPVYSNTSSVNLLPEMSEIAQQSSHQDFLLPMIFEEDRFADAIEEEVEMRIGSMYGHNHAKTSFAKRAARRSNSRRSSQSRTRSLMRDSSSIQLSRSLVAPVNTSAQDESFESSKLHLAGLIRTADSSFAERDAPAVSLLPMPTVGENSLSENEDILADLDSDDNSPNLNTFEFERAIAQRPHAAPLSNTQASSSTTSDSRHKVPRVSVLNPPETYLSALQDKKDASTFSANTTQPLGNIGGREPLSVLNQNRNVKMITSNDYSKLASGTTANTNNNPNANGGSVARKPSLLKRFNPKRSAPTAPTVEPSQEKDTFAMTSVTNIPGKDNGLRKTSGQSETAPKQNWFMKMLSGNKTETNRTFYVAAESMRLRAILVGILVAWKKYGISSISEVSQGSGGAAVITAAISSRNVLRMRSSKFRIEVRDHKSQDGAVSAAQVILEKGSNTTFDRLLKEMEKALEKERILIGMTHL